MSEKLGDRFNEGKPRWSLVPQSSLLPMVRVLEFGATKYEPFNWTKGLSITEICESLKRHLDAFMEGEDNDPESKLSHIGHIQCNALFLSWMHENRPDLDDRINLKQILEDNGYEREDLEDNTNGFSIDFWYYFKKNPSWYVDYSLSKEKDDE